MTSVATLLCPLVIALWLPLLADTRVDVPVASMVWNATWMVVLPVVTGIWLRSLRPQMPRAWDALATGLASMAIVLIILATVVFVGFMAGIVVGILLALLLFVLRYSMISAILGHHSLADYRSSVERSRSDNQLLDQYGGPEIIHDRLFLQGFTTKAGPSQARRGPVTATKSRLPGAGSSTRAPCPCSANSSSWEMAPPASWTMPAPTW